jgi:hypothetical protein
MDWDSEKCLELIGLYEKKAELWQPNQALFLPLHAPVVLLRWLYRLLEKFLILMALKFGKGT